MTCKIAVLLVSLVYISLTGQISSATRDPLPVNTSVKYISPLGLSAYLMPEGLKDHIIRALECFI